MLLCLTYTTTHLFHVENLRTDYTYISLVLNLNNYTFLSLVLNLNNYTFL